MKLNECNQHEKMAWQLMIAQYNDIVGGMENAVEDKCDDWEECAELLANHDELKNLIYQQTMNVAKNLGFAKHIKFAGKEFLMERIERRLVKDGH